MAHIILTGATGQAGSAILSYALNSPAIARISVLGRRPPKLAENQPKANIITHSDFEHYPQEILDQLRGATGCIWAQGISSRGMKEDEYTKITLDYPVAAAKAFAGLGENVKFVYMSGEGADINEKASMMFGRIKGRAERTLLGMQKELPSLKVYAIRPAVINPQGQYLAERKVTLQDRASTFLGGLFSMMFPSLVIPTDALAKVCVDLAIGEGEPVGAGKGVAEEGRLLSNTALRRLAEL
ncbi:hypothetical protein LTR86_008694 [Recurvomyces mirabilis]|nr:hypothetical protein LTR86_008694 [Recurvomyces mirabilis]